MPARRQATDAEMANINQQLSAIGAKADVAAAMREALAQALYGADAFLHEADWADLSTEIKEPFYWRADSVIEDLAAAGHAVTPR